MSDLELCYLPATEAIAQFKAKTLSPVELLDALIKRAEEVEPVINAFTYRHFCLLYTSPSPRDLSTSRMPSSA